MTILCTVCKREVLPGHRCGPDPSVVSSPERWTADLRAVGWREVRHSVWERPDGALFRGPYGAWCALFSNDSAEAQATTERDQAQDAANTQA